MKKRTRAKKRPDVAGNAPAAVRTRKKAAGASSSSSSSPHVPVPADPYSTGGESSDWGRKLAQPWSPPPAPDEPAPLPPPADPDPMPAAIAAQPPTTGAAVVAAAEAAAAQPPAEPPVSSSVPPPRLPLPPRTPPTGSPLERLARLGAPVARQDPHDRRHSRVPFRVRVEYSTVGVSADAEAENLSVSGMFIKTTAPLEVGDAVMVHFPGPSRGGAVSVAARVKWAQAIGGVHHPESGMGLEFTGLDDRKKRALSGIVALLEGEPA